MDDLVMLMVAGTDTSSHTIASLLYFLKKYPKTEEKLIAEMEKVGLVYGTETSGITMEKVQEVDYLNYVVKEAMRIDTPTVDTFGYEAYDNVKICNVSIPKGTLIRLDISSTHFNSNEWHSPTQFIPERFDPESDYFFKPNKNNEGKKEPRSANTWLTFSTGLRGCPGQSLAMLEVKIIVTYILLNFEYEVEPELLENDNVGFGLGSHFKLNLKVNKRM